MVESNSKFLLRLTTVAFICTIASVTLAKLLLLKVTPVKEEESLSTTFNLVFWESSPLTLAMHDVWGHNSASVWIPVQHFLVRNLAWGWQGLVHNAGVHAVHKGSNTTSRHDSGMNNDC